MGTLIAMAYPTIYYANQADHTFVMCSTGKKAWGCWGGKTVNLQTRRLRHGFGSTIRADKIAQPDEKASITCYLINGVCHQAANRILLPAGITVRGARGYAISESLFGTYGRIGHWPCKAPFKQYTNVSGDFQECVETPTANAELLTLRRRALSAAEKLDWKYNKDVQKLYRKSRKLLVARSISNVDRENFHLALFTNMVEYNLGPVLNRSLNRKIRGVRQKIERKRLKKESSFVRREMHAQEFVESFDKMTIDFQNEMASILKSTEYKTLFDLEPGELIVLSDKNIVNNIFNIST